jgi:hypothetical protein
MWSRHSRPARRHRRADVVYYVKCYAAPLDAGQKMKVEKSLARLLDPDEGDPR